MSVRSILAAVCGGAVLAGAVALSGCSITFPGSEQAPFQETRETWAPVAAEQAVAIESANGAIVIREAPEGSGDEVKIVAEIRATTEERLALTEVRADRQADGSLLIRVEWPDGERKGNEGARLEMDVPAGAAAAIKATTSNGAIELTGLDCPAQLESSNGAITVRGHAGAIRARTSNGAVTIEGATAEVEANSSNGRIEIAQAPGAGSITATTSNGRITIDLASGFAGAVTGRTGNGSITLPRGEDVTVQRSERREAAVTVGDDNAVRVDARTSNGSIQVRR
jgi:DUF4097 and DUF4098 domain-containing protein YvlB